MSVYAFTSLLYFSLLGGMSLAVSRPSFSPPLSPPSFRSLREEAENRRKGVWAGGVHWRLLRRRGRPQRPQKLR